MSIDRDTQRIERWLLDSRAQLPLPDPVDVLPRVLTQLAILPQRRSGLLGGWAPTRATTTLATRSRLLMALAVLLLTGILLAAWAAMGSQPSQRPLPPPLTFAPGSIAFGPADDVFLAAADGTGPTLFDPGGSEDDSVQSITFAPDGTSVAIRRADAGIVTISPDGVRLGTLPDGHLSWAPDGQRLAILPSTYPATEVSVVGREGAPLGTLALPSGFRSITMGGDTGPLWSPDGAWIALIGCSDPCDSKEGPHHVLLLDANGAGSHWLLAKSACDEYSMAWSPDSRLAVGRWCPGSVAIVAPDGSVAGDIPLPGRLGPEQLSWSPDGTRVAVMGWPTGFSPPARLVVVSADGVATAVPTDTFQFPGRVLWSTDGKRLLFSQSSGDGAYAVWSVAADGGAAEHLVDNIGFAFDVAMPARPVAP